MHFSMPFMQADVEKHQFVATLVKITRQQHQYVLEALDNYTPAYHITTNYIIIIVKQYPETDNCIMHLNSEHKKQ